MFWAGIAAHFPVQFAGIDIDVGIAPPFSLDELPPQFHPQNFRCCQLTLLMLSAKRIGVEGEIR